MARSVTLATLRTQVRERSDMVGSSFVSDAEVNRYLSSSYTRLYNELVGKGLAYFESTQTIATDGVDALYPLPADYFGTVGVDYLWATNEYVALIEFQVAERNLFGPGTGSQAEAYRIVGTNIELQPKPPAGQSYRHLYVPAPGVLDDDADTVDGVAGFEELLVLDAAIKCLNKEESSTTALVQERAILMAQIAEQAELRAIGTPRRIVDLGGIRATAGDWWYRERYRP